MKESRSIAAYDLPGRVASYDADMALMHPNREKMVRVALEVLPFAAESPIRAFDLGVGTGYFTERFLRAFPRSRVVALDGARSMVELARSRLGELAGRVDFHVGDFRDLPKLAPEARDLDVVFSSYALHHLSREEKAAVLGEALGRLKPGGWVLNADLIIGADAETEARIQQIRMRGIVERAAGRDERFSDEESTRRFIAELQRAESDQPLTLEEDLLTLRDAGIPRPTVFWLEYREAVCGGRREGAAASA